MFHGFNNVEFYDSLAASRCFGGAVLLGRPRFVEHVHAPCCRTSFISWLCLGKRNIHHDWGIQKRNLYESVLFCGEPKKVSKSKLSRVVRAIFPSFCQGPFRWMKRTSCGSLHASSWWHAPSTWSGSATDGTGGWDESSQQTAGITHEMDKETRTGGLKSMKHWNSFYI